MPTTPNSGVPYPASSAPPDVPGDLYTLAMFFETREAWTDYNANFNFDGGTGAGGFFRWRKIGKYVQVNGRIILGSSPTLNASTITFSLPTPASSLRGIPFASRIEFIDVGGAGEYVGQIRITDTSTAQLYAINTAGPTAILQPANATTPFTWGSSDYFDIDFSYTVD